MFLERCFSLPLFLTFVRSLARPSEFHDLLVAARQLVSSHVVVVSTRENSRSLLFHRYVYVCIYSMYFAYREREREKELTRPCRVHTHTYTHAYKHRSARARYRSRRRTQPPLRERFTSLAPSGPRNRSRNATAIPSMRNCTHVRASQSTSHTYTHTRARVCFSFSPPFFLSFSSYAMRRTHDSRSSRCVACHSLQLERDTRPR